MWKPTNLGQVIAKYDFKIKQIHTSKSSLECSVSFGIPIKEPSSEMDAPWACPFMIKTPTTEVLEYCFGESSFQALTLAIRLAPCSTITILAENKQLIDGDFIESDFFRDEISIRSSAK